MRIVMASAHAGLLRCTFPSLALSLTTAFTPIGLLSCMCIFPRRVLPIVSADRYSQIIRGIPEITECYNISGSYDYLFKIHAPDMKSYQEFLLNVLGTIDNLGSMESMLVMDEVKHVYGLHI